MSVGYNRDIVGLPEKDDAPPVRAGMSMAEKNVFKSVDEHGDTPRKPDKDGRKGKPCPFTMYTLLGSLANGNGRALGRIFIVGERYPGARGAGAGAAVAAAGPASRS